VTSAYALLLTRIVLVTCRHVNCWLIWASAQTTYFQQTSHRTIQLRCQLSKLPYRVVKLWSSAPQQYRSHMCWPHFGGQQDISSGRGCGAIAQMTPSYLLRRGRVVRPLSRCLTVRLLTTLTCSSCGWPAWKCHACSHTLPVTGSCTQNSSLIERLDGISGVLRW
jgi:hypothetical protein